jgi:hypothetical protein
VPAGAAFQVVVHESVPDAGCDSYSLEVYGIANSIPRLRITYLQEFDLIFLNWSASGNFFAVETSLQLGSESSFVPLNHPILESNGEFSMVFPVQEREAFFRLVRR